MSLYDMAWVFFLYAFIGWCVEVIYAAVNQGTFVNRGFLNGPVCPIYGCGVLAVVLCLTPLSGDLLLLYVASVLLTSLLEGAVGFLMEKLFHQRWWDYSDIPLNIGGYVCLKFSLKWGLACVFVVDVVQPRLMAIVDAIPGTLGVALLIFFAAMLAVDLVATVMKVAKLNRQLAELDQVVAAIRAVSDKVGSGVAEGAITLMDAGGKAKRELIQKRDDIVERIAREQKRFLQAFPDLQTRKYRDNLSEIIESLKKRFTGRGA